MMISDSLLEQIIEGALMASGHPLSVERIQALFEESDVPDKDRVEAALKRLGERSANRGYELLKVATGYRFQVKQDVVKWVSRLWEEKPQRYSRALLETLAIIAYRQPVTRGEIEDIRGVAVSSHITKTLLEREWVQVVGHRDVPGRPAMYATTKMFLDYFSMESLEQLPTLEEIQEIADANHALELEDKVEEGNYDLSHTDNDSDGQAALDSAAEDLAAAEAIVQQVEDNVFRKPEEDEELEAETEEQSAESIEPPAPKSIADLADAIGAHQDKQKEKADLGEGNTSKELSAEAELSDAEDALHNAIIQEQALSADTDAEQDIDEDQQAAMIAKMLAEQEALLAAKESAEAEVASASDVADYAVTDTDEIESSVVEQENDLADAPSVFGQITETSDEATLAPAEDDAELQAAMEEEAIALLEAEQEELLALQDAEQSANESESEEEKSISDLANKFTTELD